MPAPAAEVHGEVSGGAAHGPVPPPAHAIGAPPPRGAIVSCHSRGRGSGGSEESGRQRRAWMAANAGDRFLRAAKNGCRADSPLAATQRTTPRGRARERERAELEADTAIAIAGRRPAGPPKIMWTEHRNFTQTRLAIEAQAEIDREQQRRRVVEALEGPVRSLSERTLQPVEDEVYLPIAAETGAASRRSPNCLLGQPITALRYREKPSRAQVQPEGGLEPREKRATPVIRSIPDATKAAAWWIRPLAPPFVARMLDNTTVPLQGTARQAFGRGRAVRSRSRSSAPTR